MSDAIWRRLDNKTYLVWFQRDKSPETLWRQWAATQANATDIERAMTNAQMQVSINQLGMHHALGHGIEALSNAAAVGFFRP